MRNLMQKSALVLAMLAAGATSALAAGSEDEFKAAYAAADAANKEAEALAKASIFQATSEKTRWRDMEIR